MKPDIYENNGEGILCVYKNPKWLVSIKNWKPDNDIAGIAHLEIHHSTDEQFILAAGKAILITADRVGDRFDIQLTLMEQGKVYNVPAECWPMRETIWPLPAEGWKKYAASSRNCWRLFTGPFQNRKHPWKKNDLKTQEELSHAAIF